MMAFVMVAEQNRASMIHLLEYTVSPPRAPFLRPVVGDAPFTLPLSANFTPRVPVGSRSGVAVSAIANERHYAPGHKNRGRRRPKRATRQHNADRLVDRGATKNLCGEPCSEAGEGTAMPELFTVLGDAGSQSPTRGPQCHCYCAKHDRNGGVLS